MSAKRSESRPLEDDPESPVTKKQYPISLTAQGPTQKELDRLLSEDVITPAETYEFASSAFPIYKKDGSIRLVVDYRALNAITAKDAYPFPNVMEELLSLPKVCLFAQIDLRQGYRQIMMDPNHESLPPS